MGNKEFTEILLEYFQKEQEHLPNNEWKQINILINDFSDNRFFSILNEEEQYRMALIISERIRIELLNDDNIFVFTAKSSEDTHFNITPTFITPISLK
jgi:hypothetical protein